MRAAGDEQRTIRASATTALVLAVAASCGGDPVGVPAGDSGSGPDAPLLAIDAARTWPDAGAEQIGDGGLGDGGFGDGGSTTTDGGLGDAGASSDGGPSTTDAGTGGDGGTTIATDGGSTSTGSACTAGPGRALWRLRFPANGAGYATVESWDNGCDYSLADQACSLSGEPHDQATWGPGIVFNSSTDYFRVRFSVAGLDFTEAVLYMGAHADGSGIPNALLESPIYGSLSFAPSVPISTHRTYAIDWSAFLSPGDSPSLTAVTMRSSPIGMAVSFMELCVE